MVAIKHQQNFTPKLFSELDPADCRVPDVMGPPRQSLGIPSRSGVWNGSLFGKKDPDNSSPSKSVLIFSRLFRLKNALLGS
jgi:hypothetical protein